MAERFIFPSRQWLTGRHRCRRQRIRPGRIAALCRVLARPSWRGLETSGGSSTVSQPHPSPQTWTVMLQHDHRVHDLRRRHQAAAAGYRHQTMTQGPATPRRAPAGIIWLVSTAFKVAPWCSAPSCSPPYGGAVATHGHGSPLFSHVLFGVYLGVILWGGPFLRDPRVRRVRQLAIEGIGQCFSPSSSFCSPSSPRARYAATRANDFVVSRSAGIEAPAEAIFPLINDFCAGPPGRLYENSTRDEAHVMPKAARARACARPARQGRGVGRTNHHPVPVAWWR